MNLDIAGMHRVAAEQGIDAERLDASLAEALRLAYLKTPHAAKHARVELDERGGSFTIWAQNEIPQEPTEADPHPVPKLSDEYDDTPSDFGRQAAYIARQVITALFRKAADDKIFGAFAGQKGKLITGVVQQDSSDRGNLHIAVGDVEAILPRREQVPGERFRHGERVRVYVVSVNRGLKGPEIIVSRSHPELVRRLFEREVPELVTGAVQIMSIAREAGERTKIAVRANAQGVNPKGSLIGPAGQRVRAVMENLGEEKIDIVDWSEDPAKFVGAALSPAHAVRITVVSEKTKTAVALIHNDQLSLAIGKEGQNARLAAKLTGWKIGVESYEAAAQKSSESGENTEAGEDSHAAAENGEADASASVSGNGGSPVSEGAQEGTGNPPAGETPGNKAPAASTAEEAPAE